MCLLGVETLPLLVSVTPCGDVWACPIGFPYIISKTIFLLFSHFSFPETRLGETIYSYALLFTSIMGKNTKFVHVQDISSLYSTMDIIDTFCHDIRFSSTSQKKYVIMDPCSQEEYI